MLKGKNIFITGASGFVGSNLLPVLIEQGANVKALVRPSSNTEIIDRLGVEKINGDITILKSFKHAVKKVDIIYNLAGVVTDWAPKAQYYNVHVIGTKNVLQVASENGVQKVIHMSTSEVLRPHGFVATLSDENGIGDPRDYYTVTKIKGEEYCDDFVRKRGLEVIIFRPTWLYGPGDTTLIPEIVSQLNTRVMFYIHSFSNHIPLIYIKNMVNALLLAANVHCKSNKFLISDHEEITWQQLSNYLSEELRLKYHFDIKIPYQLAKVSAVFIESLSKALSIKKRPILTKIAVEMLSADLKADISHLERVMGYKQMVTLKDGLENTITWLKEKR